MAAALPKIDVDKLTIMTSPHVTARSPLGVSRLNAHRFLNRRNSSGSIVLIINTLSALLVSHRTALFSLIAAV